MNSSRNRIHHKTRLVKLERRVLEKNETFAAQIRGLLNEKQIIAYNLISSPGSGKTTLLEKTFELYSGSLRFAVIEGDQQTDNDAQRIRKTGVPAIQINTITGCHLNAQQVQTALQTLPLETTNTVFIENVGNLVCPASFDLGEHHKIAILSVTEGEDKPIKYPLAFRLATAMIITKTDLLPYVRFDIEACRRYARSINPNITIIELSCYTKTGLDDWFTWLEATRTARPNE